MLTPASDHDIAVLLPGGGARAAYQVGALRAVARIVSRSTRQPFRIICGTSAGAINAATLAMNADNFRRGVARLLQWWNTMEVSRIYHADVIHVALHGVRWFASVLVGAGGPKDAASMLDNAPLRAFLQRHLELGRIDEHVRSGALRAVAINATSYTTGHAVTFYQGDPAIAPWRRTRRRGEPTVLAVEHLLASTAIPFVFPAELVGADYYADGSVRQITPLSPPLHLGARRILVVAVGQFGGQRPEASQTPRYPSFAQMAGHALASIFLDNLGADLERLQRLNQVLHLVPEARQQRNQSVAHIDALVLGPSQDLGAMALPYAARLPMGVRYLLHGLGSTRGTGASLLSYLMFEREYARALLDLGFRDAMARRDEIEAFLAPEGTRYDPVFPLELA